VFIVDSCSDGRSKFLTDGIAYSQADCASHYRTH
jgi:hypothetical protein